ncbi:MAG: ATP-binding protein, partial [Bryobacteraceae bacterium]
GVVLGFVGALLILLAVDAISYLNIQDLITNASWVTRTHRLTSQIELLTSEVSDVFSATDGYVISETPAHLASYYHARADIEQTIATLGTSTTNTPRLRLKAISTSLSDTLALSQDVINLARSGHRADAAQLVLGAQAEALSLRLRTQLLDLKSEETSLLLQRINQTDRSARKSTATQIGASLLSSLILLLVYLHLNREVATRKRSEERLRQLGAQVQVANQLLEKSNEELTRVSRSKSAFLSGMSHEFRTPLNAITGYAELLSEASAGVLSDKQRRFVGHIQTGAKHLLDLINDLLDLSKIEAEKIDLQNENVIVPQTLNEIICAIQPLALAKDIEIENRVAESLTVYADPLRFRQIVFNLLSNAVKFTAAGGRVWIEAETGAGFIAMSVCDTGIGIRRHEHEMVFENFYQAHADGNHLQEGTGLGLAITKRLIVLHGGTIQLESEPGQGSRFTFSLPAQRPC